MKIKILCPEYIAQESHRFSEEEIDAEVNDTIADIKIKITLIYTSLETDDFHLSFNHRKLQDEEKLLTILKTHQGDSQLAFIVKK